MKVLYFDTETTGLDPKVNEIIQFSALFEIDGNIINKLDIHIRPTRWDQVSQEALNITGKTIQDLETYMVPDEAVMSIRSFLDANMDKYNKYDKAYPAGHNVTFDLEFFQSFWKQHGDQYGIGVYTNWRALDSRVLANFLIFSGAIKNVPDVKLETLCKHFGIEIDAHDSLSDIKATRELIRAMVKLWK